MIDISISGAVSRFPHREIKAYTTEVVRLLRNARVVKGKSSTVSLVFVSDEAMAALNHKFRRKNRTTDVLTFPADPAMQEPGSSEVAIGEIVISLQQAARQATEQKHSLATEVRYLILHGLIHAHGYDHETDRGEMNELELKMRERLQLS